MSEAFVQAFARFWEAPDPAKLDTLLHEDVVLIQPLAPPIHGLARAREAFRHNLRLVPDLHAVVDHAHAFEGGVVVQFRLQGHLARRAVEWPAVDVIRLRDDRALERAAYFDTLPLLGALLASPSAWWRWWRSGNARPWAAGRRVPAGLSDP